jgi:hypothetical protein
MKINYLYLLFSDAFFFRPKRYLKVIIAGNITDNTISCVIYILKTLIKGIFYRLKSFNIKNML